MGKLYRTREGEATAVDTKTQLTTLGSEAAPGPLLVPQGKSKINRIIAAAMQNHAAATGYSAFLRIEGGGMTNGPESLPICAGGNSVATGGNASAPPVDFKNLGFQVTPGQEIQLFGEMAGTDVGQVSFAATVVFE